MTTNRFNLRRWLWTLVWFLLGSSVGAQQMVAADSMVVTNDPKVMFPGGHNFVPSEKINDTCDSTAVLELAASRANAHRMTMSMGCRVTDGTGVHDRNRYWCYPYGRLLVGPCDRDAYSECRSSTPPLMYATAEFVSLFRDQQTDLPFQTLGIGGPEVLETGRFKTEFDAGVRLQLGVALNEYFRLEGVYLGPHEWSSRVAVRNGDPNRRGGNGNLFSPFSNFGLSTSMVGVDFNDFASIEMESQFNSVELNLRRLMVVPMSSWLATRSPGVSNSYLIGVRHVTLDERFGYVSRSTLPVGSSVNRAETATENEMTGLQLGLLSQILLTRGQGYVDFDLKGGIYRNNMSLSSAYEFADGTGTIMDRAIGTDSLDRTSFVGEIALTYVRQLTTHLTCCLGYNAFWLTGVSLAGANMNRDIDLLRSGPVQLAHQDNLVVHGPTIGFTFAY